MDIPSGQKPELLIVDDDPLIVDTLTFVLGKEYNVRAAGSREQVKSLLRQLDVLPELALVDLGLPPAPHRPDEGFQLIADLLAHSPTIKILVLSGQNDEANARYARTLGAAEFIAKPCEPEVLKAMLAKVKRMAEVERSSVRADTGLIGSGPAITKLHLQIAQYATAPFPVLVEGESGSGKELVAQSLHRQGPRDGKPYLALNCAAISPSLVEPTLFGYVKGAFTGASSSRSGYFEDAHEGTLFLDEIGELPLELQSKLLRVLENGEYQRVGETQKRVSNARVIAATNRDLRQEVRSSRFRADLYHRLSVFSITVPPLRELGDDKNKLLSHYSALYAHQSNVRPFKLAADSLDLWMQYGFPGNVRELRNIVIRLTTKYPGQTINSEQLLGEFDWEEPMAAPVQTGQAGDFKSSVAAARVHLQTKKGFLLDEALRDLERSYVEAALDITRGNLSQAAKLLGIHRTTLYSRMQNYATGIEEGN
ncbi:MAG: sigma-54-dependent transcriptional regulator [Burkholderiales bacterium]|jgi:DNA-binding NtrC family response regulator